jgi:phospholipid transport system transporter-binding protein
VAASERDTVEVVDLGSGNVQVRGALTFATARRVRAAAIRLLAASGGASLAVDCAGVTASDSAGLAVLLDWLALSKRQSRSIRFLNLPAPLRAVAHISEVESLLSQGLTA